MARTGGCLCGFIQYEVSGEPGPAGYCHCSDCRKVTGSAFIVSIRVAAEHFRITSGNNTKSYTKTADSGNSITRDFCPECGSPIFTTSPHSPDYVWVRAGTLDDPCSVKPEYEYWTDSKVDWAVIPEDITGFRRGRN